MRSDYEMQDNVVPKVAGCEAAQHNDSPPPLSTYLPALFLTVLESGVLVFAIEIVVSQL